MTANDTRSDRVATHRDRVDRRLIDRVVATVDRDVRSGAFTRFASIDTADWPELRRALHVRIRRAMLDEGMGGGERGVARVDRAVASALDAFEQTQGLR